METIVFIVLTIVSLHFLYESVILPSLTLKIKYKFSKLKDEVIMMAIDKKISQEEANYVLHRIDISSRNMQYMTLSTLLHTQSFISKNPDFKKHGASQNKIKNERLKNIKVICAKYLFKALIYNSLMWAIYIIPICIVFFAYGRIKRTSKSLIERLNTTPEKDFDRVIHGGEYCPI
ncbi:hypothetical protein [Flavobacterium sp. SORGH_AS_0622]|uniref:hypothetical protein n=1 Tax=Flavobacterium sp. SORGH_AS_0622 TaxID=3041772 RepID=UPI0027857489|nr:hypothetical protein [Flavobacterium sp. SORGH_AS_0622]MDQ1164620.1 hypothetical protein [Flavobacterium sp. SORGH_AS_0622]